MTPQKKRDGDHLTKELEALGNAIRERREKVGLKLKQLAVDEEGQSITSYTTLSNMENGRIGKPSKKILAHCERRLGVPAGTYVVRLQRAQRLAAAAPSAEPAAAEDLDDYRLKPFAVTYQEVSYVFETGRTPSRWQSFVVLRPECDEMAAYRIRYLYTGDDAKVSFHPLFGIADFRWLPQTVTGFRGMEVDLERPVRLGTTGSVAYEWRMEPGTEPPKPFASINYDRPTTNTEHLILRVLFASDALPSQVYEYETSASQVETPLALPKPLEWSATGRYERELFNVPTDRPYGLKWEW